MNLIINTPTDNIGIKKFNEALAELQKRINPILHKRLTNRYGIKRKNTCIY